MAELTVDLTYGNALYLAAKELDKVPLFSKELTELEALLKQEPTLLAFMESPAIAASDKKRVLKTIFTGQICEELVNLLYILIDKGRTRKLPGIIRAYRDLVNRAEGLAFGKILSVESLHKEQLEQLEAETGKLLKVKVKLDNEIDASLLGGIKIYVNGKVIDASFRKRLQDMEFAIR